MYFGTSQAALIFVLFHFQIYSLCCFRLAVLGNFYPSALICVDCCAPLMLFLKAWGICAIALNGFLQRFEFYCSREAELWKSSGLIHLFLKFWSPLLGYCPFLPFNLRDLEYRCSWPTWSITMDFSVWHCCVLNSLYDPYWGCCEISEVHPDDSWAEVFSHLASAIDATILVWWLRVMGHGCSHQVLYKYVMLWQ